MSTTITIPPDGDDGDTLLTVAEVARELRVSKMTIYRLIGAGTLPALRIGRSFRVPEPAYRAYLAATGVQP